MRLDSVDGSSVDLAVTGYQFPGSTADPDDGNWLMVRGQVCEPGRSWGFHEPCMTTGEARRLAAWLHGLGNAQPSVPELEFIEPNVRFEVTGQSPEQITLEVGFSHESRPESGAVRGPGVRVTLAIRRQDLDIAARIWEEPLRHYPQR